MQVQAEDSPHHEVTRLSARHLRALLEQAAVGLASIDREGRVTEANAAFRTLAGAPALAAGTPLADVLLGAVGAAAADVLAAVRRRPDAPASVEVHVEGDRWLEVAASAAAEAPCELLMLRDVSARYQVERDLRLRADVLGQVGEAVLVLDRRLRVTYTNAAAARLAGQDEADLAGRRIADLVAYRWLTPDAPEPLREMLFGTGQAEGEVAFDRADGREATAEVTLRLLRRDTGAVSGVLVLVRDVTVRKAMEERLLHSANHDALTGLPNRKLFLFRIWGAITANLTDPGRHYAVLFLDLDRFKVANDSLGHVVGDDLLKALALRLEGCVRGADLVARLGGDEFGVLLEDLKTPQEAERVADRILEQLVPPFDIDGHEVFVSASIGIAQGDDVYESPEDLLRDADAAMYQAKATGQGGYVVFDPSMRKQISALFRLENDLRRAIERDELQVWYQPIVALRTGRIAGFEALVRWQHPERGLVLPAAFIPLAEETGLILQIDEWVLEHACEQVQQWQPDGALWISVNCSAQSFRHVDLDRRVQRVLDASGLAPERLHLEVTENVLGEALDLAVADLALLKAQGVQVSIDDFGTGYSSLSLLHTLPLDVLKVDRSFVQRLDTPGQSGAIVESIIALAQRLGLDVVAEGVEDPQTLGRLRAERCRYGQGFLFSPPVEAARAEDLLASDRLPWSMYWS